MPCASLNLLKLIQLTYDVALLKQVGVMIMCHTDYKCQACYDRDDKGQKCVDINECTCRVVVTYS
eukprot:COSAG01_NODE_16623_length_1220_cov_1.064228_3_plen_65_part_00